ncbi:MAG TPA: phosphoglycerate mutase family protein [Acidimicrobiales bacterium]|nr:phosphoglycerate mutase family protein [Acidimicrobiales bacterium]
MTIHLVRHAEAGSRRRWAGPDDARPLNGEGRRQATHLADQLATLGVTRVLSSPYARCVQTVEPLAGLLGIRVEAVDVLAEGSRSREVRSFVEDLAATGAPVALCSHGDVIPELLRVLARRGVDLDPDGPCQKGSVWTLSVEAGRITSGRYTPPSGELPRP